MSQNQLPQPSPVSPAPSVQEPSVPAPVPTTAPPTAPNTTPSQLQVFIARPEQNYGPYSLLEVNTHLATEHIKATDLAWHEGAAGWMPLGQIAGVVIPPTRVAPPPASYPAPQLQPPQPPLAPQRNAWDNQSVGSGANGGVESVVFDITPSITPDIARCFFTLGFWLLVLPWRYMGTLSSRYRLTTERLTITTGLLSKHCEEVEIYRVKDVTFEQSSMDRMLGTGTVTVFVNDATTPRIYLQNIDQPMKVKEQIRQISRAARKNEGIQSVEYLPSF